MSNRLPILAAEVWSAHEGVLDAAKTAAKRAIEAGHALIEAKALLGHGDWLPWLKEHCAIPERTAQLYMKIARLGLEPATVADMGLKAAGKTFAVLRSPDYNPFAHCDAEGTRQWKLYILYGVRLGFAADAVMRAIEWTLQRQFKNPDEWHGPEGKRFRAQCGLRDIGLDWLDGWLAFAAASVALTVEEIDAALEATAMLTPTMGGSQS